MKRILEHLNQNWIKYGFESFAILISILAAFALNSWNENRKESIKENTLMINLKRDFTLRQQELLEFKEARRNAMVAIRELNRAIANQKILPSKEKLDTCIMLISNAMTFNDQFKMLDVLFSTGMINDLKNEELKQRLLLWPQQVEEMMEEQRSRIAMRIDFFEPLLFKYVALREVFELFSFRGYATPKGEPVTYASNYQGLLSDPTFERYLAELENLLRVNEIDSNILLDNAEQIIKLLDQEIK